MASLKLAELVFGISQGCKNVVMQLHCAINNLECTYKICSDMVVL